MVTQQFISPSPSYPGLNRDRSWDDHYRNRERGRGRSREVSSISSSSRQRRPRSADARPQYNHNHRASCLTMFYPTVQNESRARVSYGETPGYFPSQLPKVNGVYHGDNDGPIRQPQDGIKGHNDKQMPIRQTRSHEVVQMMPGDPYESTIRLPDARLGQSYLSEQDFLKDSLIMFGNVEQTTVTSGLSQEDLIRKKRREETMRRRKGKKKPKNRVVNLPSTLFPTHTNRQHHQEQEQREEQPQPQPQPQHQHQHQHQYPMEPPRQRQQLQQHDQSQHPLEQEQDQSRSMSTISTTLREPRREIRSIASSENEYAPKAQERGWRSSMVRRMKSGSSTGQRWKIFPSLSRSRSGSESPSRRTHISRSVSESPSRRTHNSRYPSDEIRPSACPSDEFRSRSRSSAAFPSDEYGSRNGKSVFSADDLGSRDSHEDQEHSRALDPPSRGGHESMDEIEDWNVARDDAGQLAISQLTEDGFRAEHIATGYPKRDPRDTGDALDFGAIYDPAQFGSERGVSFDSTKNSADESNAFEQFAPNRDGGSFPTSATTTFAQFDPNSATACTTTYKKPSSRSRSPRKQQEPEAFSPRSLSYTQSTPKSLCKSNYVMEPKEYSKVTSSPSQSTSRDNSSRNQRARSNEVDYRKTKAYRTYDDTHASSDVRPFGADENYFPNNFASAPSTPSQSSSVRGKYPSRSSGTKTSPTSIADFPSSNVRWSDNLDQKPTPSQRRIYIKKPKSILRKVRRTSINSNSECPSDETTPLPERAGRRSKVRISDGQPEKGEFLSDLPSAMGFVDNRGRTLSPIPSNSGDEEYDMAPEDNHEQLPTWMNHNNIFEKNIPEQFQRAFLAENGVTKRDDDSGLISDAYTEFIESVASVVVQTAARQFLAKTRIKSLRQERAAESRRDVSYGQQKSLSAVPYASRSTPRNSPPRGVSNLMYELAAIRIQSGFRGWWARDCITVDNYCACIIQKNFRSYRSRSDFIFMLCCTVAIQAAFRGYFVRRRAGMPRNMNPDRAAIIIQSKWRSFSSEMKFLRDYEDIMIVQSMVRGWITRRLLRSWLRAHNIQASSLLLGEIDRSQHDTSHSYSLPKSYHNHTEFMKNNLAAPVKQTGEYHEPRTGSGIISDQRDERQQNGVVSRAARAEIERRRKEKELAKQANFVEQKRREAETAAHAAEMKERRRRMDMKAQERRKQEARKKEEAAAAAPSDFTDEEEEKKDQEFTFAERIPFDQELDISSEKPEPAQIVKRAPQKSRPIAPIRPTEKESYPMADRLNSLKKSSGKEPTAISGASQVLAGWRNRERNSYTENQTQQESAPPKNNIDTIHRTGQREYDGNRREAAKQHSGEMAERNEPRTKLGSDLIDETSGFQRRNPRTTPRIQSKVYANAAHRPTGNEEANQDAVEEEALVRPQLFGSKRAVRRQHTKSQSTSKLHATMRVRRSEKENKRINKMHAIFRTIGFMAGQAEPQTKSLPEESLAETESSSTMDDVPKPAIETDPVRDPISDATPGVSNRSSGQQSTLAPASFYTTNGAPATSKASPDAEDSAPKPVERVAALQEAITSSYAENAAPNVFNRSSEKRNTLRYWAPDRGNGTTTGASATLEVSPDAEESTSIPVERVAALQEAMTSSYAENATPDVFNRSSERQTSSRHWAPDRGNGTTTQASATSKTSTDAEESAPKPVERVAAVQEAIVSSHADNATLGVFKRSSGKRTTTLRQWAPDRGDGATNKASAKSKASHQAEESAPEWVERMAALYEPVVTSYADESAFADSDDEPAMNSTKIGFRDEANDSTVGEDPNLADAGDDSAVDEGPNPADAGDEPAINPSKNGFSAEANKLTAGEDPIPALGSQGTILAADEHELPSIHLKSPLHIAMQARRSGQEQQRINEMHNIFLEVGLMGGRIRQKKEMPSVPEEKIEASARDLAQQGYADVDASEPSASDLLRAWKNRDQTQPKMRGKLF